MKRRVPEILEPEELVALLSQPNVATPTGLRNRAMLQLMADGGLRVSEVLGLRTSDLRTDHVCHRKTTVLHLKATKGGHHRVVALPADADNYLRLWLEERRRLGIPNGLVFTTLSTGQVRGPFAREGKLLSPGGRLNDRYIRQMCQRLGKKAGIDRRVHPHMLRHTFATRLLDHTRNIRQVQEALGHADLSTTMVYTKVKPRELTEAMVTLPRLRGHQG